MDEHEKNLIESACSYIETSISLLHPSLGISLETIKSRFDITKDVPQYADFNLLVKCIFNTRQYPILNNIIQDTLSKFNVVNIKSSEGDTILFSAACFSAIYSSAETVKIIMDAGADINIQDNYGQTVLNLMVPGYGIVSAKNIIKLLLENGANINIPNKFGITPLYRIINYYSRNTIPPDFVELVTLLLQFGADPNILCVNNFSPLHCATEIYSIDVASKIIKLLVQAGASVNTLDNYGFNALSYMVTRYFMSYEFYTKNNASLIIIEDIINFLIESGSDTNVKTSYGTIPLLHVAIGLSSNINNPVIYKILNTKSTDVNLLSKGTRNSALHFAASRNAFDIVRILLLERDANPNVQNINGKTPLHCAAEVFCTGNKDNIIDLLLENGANGNLRDDKGNLYIYYLKDEIKKVYADKKMEEITKNKMLNIAECDICCENSEIIECNHMHKICKMCLVKVCKFRCELCLQDY